MCYDFSHFLPPKRFCNAYRHITVLSTHNQLSARVDSQINFSVVVHGRMQDLQRGQLLLGGWYARVVRGMLPPKKIFNGAIWCVLEYIFIIFFYFQKVLKYHFNTKIIINCSHVLARGSRSMVHSPLIIFIKGGNL